MIEGWQSLESVKENYVSKYEVKEILNLIAGASPNEAQDMIAEHYIKLNTKVQEE